MTTGEEPAVRASALGRRPRLPAVEGVWVFVGADSVVFLLLFGLFSQARHADPALFEASRQSLNADIGGVNTLILLTSSWLVALGIRALAHDDLDRAPRFVLGGVLTGGLFVVSKIVEYTQKIAVGLTPATDPFFMWYFVLTGIHLLHVLLGIAALSYVWRGTRARRYSSGDRVVPEGVATFWHLVDFLWIVIFPLLYLQR